MSTVDAIRSSQNRGRTWWLSALRAIMASIPFRPAASKRRRAYHGSGCDSDCGRDLALCVVLEVRRGIATPGVPRVQALHEHFSWRDKAG